MRFIALALIMTVASVGCGFPFSKQPSYPSGERLREHLWSPLPGGISLWEYQPPELPLRVYADPKVREQTNTVIKAWNALLGKRVMVLSDVSDFDVAVFNGFGPDPGRSGNLNGITQLVPHGAGRYPILPVIVLFIDSNDTLMHEFGHMLGLEHDPKEPYSIMFPYSSMRALPHVESLDLAILQWVFDI